jgi:RHS repeat-associated protein
MFFYHKHCLFTKLSRHPRQTRNYKLRAIYLYFTHSPARKHQQRWPVVNLTYVSGQQGGIVGQGWNINTISCISRMSTRLDIDGYRDGVDFDWDDKLALDGQRLLIKTGDYLEIGSTYETEVQSNTKIEFFNNRGGMFFITTAPDGSRTWYGGLTASDATAFYITRFEDINGNFMTYHYSRPFQKSLCLTEIRFSANKFTNPTPLNKMVFTYKQALRTENAFVGGNKIEKAELLQKIEVFTNNLMFKTYRISHVFDSNGYERVSQLIELNSNNEASNPISFEYNKTTHAVDEVVTSYNDSFNISKSPQLSGDFDGDGRLDFIDSMSLYTKLFLNGNTVNNLPFKGAERQKFTATTTTNGKLNQNQSIVFADEKIDQIEFKIHNLVNNSIVNSYNKTILIDNFGNCQDICTQLQYDEFGNVLVGPRYPKSRCTADKFIKTSNKYNEGDFNGDGISEVLIFSYDQSRTYVEDPNGVGLSTDPDNPNPDETQPNNGPVKGGCGWKFETSENFTSVKLLDLNQNSSTIEGTNGFLNIDNYQLLIGDNRYFMDFNTDGKTDVLVVNKNKSYRIVGFKQRNEAPWVELEVLGEGVLPDYSSTKQILFGDYNGDGKTDVMLPDADNEGCGSCDKWHIYYSNPNPEAGEFFVKDTYKIISYMPYLIKNTFHDFNKYFAIDVNKDGKTDLVNLFLTEYQYDEILDPKDWDTQWHIKVFINDIGYTNTFNYSYISPSNHYDNNPVLPIPISSSYRYKGLDSDLLIVRYEEGGSFDKTITYIDYKKDFTEDNLLKKVDQSNGAIVDEIIYKEMTPNDANNGLGTLDNFYSSTESLQYPNIEIKQMPTNKLVSKIKNTSLGIAKYQDFMYHGLSINLNGIGLIGFKKTARSNWYKSSTDKKIWTVTENDPLQRNALIRQYITKPSNTSFSFLLSSTSNLSSLTENTFNQNTDFNSKKYSILLNKQKTTDFLTNIFSEKIYETYSPDYFLPLKVTTNTFLGYTLQGSSTSITDYESATTGTGSAYYIGRPKTVNTSITQFANTLTGAADTKTSNQKLFYTNGRLTRTEKTPNADAVTLVEEMDYFSNGLLKSKKMSATGTTNPNNAVSPRTTAYTYDPTNRFVKTTTDTENLTTTNLSYHPIYGAVTSQQNPFNQTTTSVYDNWGKPTTITDFLGKSIVSSYQRANNVFTTTQVGDDGTSSMTVTDALGRQIKKGVKDINGNWVFVNTEYDHLGKKTKESEPYFGTAAPTQWTVFEYDDYSRPTKTTAPTGKIITTTYNGLTIAAADSVMTKTKVMNALGQVVRATDAPGGNIDYKFDANGNLLQSDYENIKIDMRYDNWGRKIELKDSSAGTYTYGYNAFGETTTETTPKGSTTYNLDAVGRVLTKTVTGDGTAITSTYTYDPANKWLNSLVVSNPIDGNSDYTYSYDPTTRQLNKTVENLFAAGSNTPFATFTKIIAFDTFGRLTHQTATASSHGKTSTKTTTQTYKNGIAWQILDGTTVKWQTNAVNARGQLLTANLGNGIAVNNKFDAFGYTTENKHLLGTTNVMTLKNVFEPVLGNLTSRYNSMFDVFENFEYDAQDRLTTWDTTEANLVNCTFTNSTDGFTVFSPNGWGNLSLANGKLNVRTNGEESGTQKTILTTAAVGDKVRIKAEVAKTAGNALLRARIIETDPISQDFVLIDLGPIANNVFETEYVVSSYPNIDVQFYIVQDPNNNGWGLDPGDGSGQNLISCNFTVDNFVVNGVKINTQDYDNRGRITANKLGTYNYNISNKPYQNSSVFTSPEANDYYANRPVQNITYNAFKAPIQIEEVGTDKISFGYNAMQQRSSMFFGSVNNDKFARPYRKYYSADGSMEIKATFAAGNIGTPAAVEFVTYIGGDAYSAPMVLKSDGSTQNYFYLHRDYQGSIMAISNAVGAVVEKRLFDPWGAIAQVQDGAGNALAQLTFFDRGYTGHQHLESVGLIHMNGRIYDPKLHRFLQPDNFVQDPYNTQNFNRYAYCINNPLKYTDPSGNIFGIDDVIISAIIIGAMVGGGIYAINGLRTGTFTIEGFVKSSFIGALSGAVTGGIAQGFGSICNFSTNATGFWSGAAIGGSTGFVTGVASSAFNSLTSGGSIKLGQLLQDGLIGAAIGGAIQGIGGGIKAQKNDSNFWTGKSNWAVVGSHNFGTTTFVAKQFDSSKWFDVSQTELGFSKQYGQFTCTYHCKKSVDWFFMGGDEDQYINQKWYNRVSPNGLPSNQIKVLYEYSGYNTNSFTGDITSNSFYGKWVVNEMKLDHVVQIGWQPDLDENLWHASLISKVEQNVKSLVYRFTLMDPMNYNTFSFDKLRTSISVWKPFEY